MEKINQIGLTLECSLTFTQTMMSLFLVKLYKMKLTYIVHLVTKANECNNNAMTTIYLNNTKFI